MMQNEAMSSAGPDEPQRLDPVAMTMDIVAQINAVTAAFAAAQAGCAQSALDRLVSHGRQIAEARHPISVIALQMECCVSLLDAVAAPFRAALREGQDHLAARAPAVQPSARHGAVTNTSDTQVSRRPSRATDAAGASERPTRLERTE